MISIFEFDTLTPERILTRKIQEQARQAGLRDV